MPNFIKDYANKWKNMVTTYSPKAWSFVSFFLPLMAIPLAVEGVKYVAKKVKEKKK